MSEILSIYQCSRVFDLVIQVLDSDVATEWTFSSPEPRTVVYHHFQQEYIADLGCPPATSLAVFEEIRTKANSTSCSCFERLDTWASLHKWDCWLTQSNQRDLG